MIGNFKNPKDKVFFFYLKKKKPEKTVQKLLENDSHGL